jgi:hypothetical protein
MDTVLNQATHAMLTEICEPFFLVPIIQWMKDQHDIEVSLSELKTVLNMPPRLPTSIVGGRASVGGSVKASTAPTSIPRQCTSIKRDGKQCEAVSIEGCDHCRQHKPKPKKTADAKESSKDAKPSKEASKPKKTQKVVEPETDAEPETDVEPETDAEPQTEAEDNDEDDEDETDIMNLHHMDTKKRLYRDKVASFAVHRKEGKGPSIVWGVYEGTVARPLKDNEKDQAVKLHYKVDTTLFEKFATKKSNPKNSTKKEAPVAAPPKEDKKKKEASKDKSKKTSSKKNKVTEEQSETDTDAAETDVEEEQDDEATVKAVHKPTNPTKNFTMPPVTMPLATDDEEGTTDYESTIEQAEDEDGDDTDKDDDDDEEPVHHTPPPAKKTVAPPLPVVAAAKQKVNVESQNRGTKLPPIPVAPRVNNRR